MLMANRSTFGISNIIPGLFPLADTIAVSVSDFATDSCPLCPCAGGGLRP